MSTKSKQSELGKINLTLGDTLKIAQEVAEKQSRSVSSLVRHLIKKEAGLV